MNRVNLATMYGVGLSPKAPGTAGSAVAALLAYGVLQCSHGWALLAAGTLLFAVLGTRSTSRYMAIAGTAHDPKEVVIDELVGQWLTYVLLPYGLSLAGCGIIEMYAYPPMLWLHLALGFVLFRLFDILKPWPISWADRTVRGGFGVMLDDLLAGLVAAALLYVVEDLLLEVIHRGVHVHA